MRTRIAHTLTRRTNTDARMVGAHGGSPLEAASADYEVIMMMNDVMFSRLVAKDTFPIDGGHSISFARKVQNVPKVQILPLCSCIKVLCIWEIRLG